MSINSGGEEQESDALLADIEAAAVIAAAASGGIPALPPAPPTPPPMTEEQQRLADQHKRQVRIRSMVRRVLDMIPLENWEGIRDILEDSNSEIWEGEKRQIFSADVLSYFAEQGAPGMRYSGADVNIFQAICMSGKDVPLDILSSIVEIDKRVLSKASQSRSYARAIHRYEREEQARREPIDIACLHGHSSVLKFILDAAGPLKAKALAQKEDPEYDVSLLDVCFAKQLMPHRYMGVADPSSDDVAELSKRLLQTFLESIAAFQSESDMNEGLADSWEKAKTILSTLFCNPEKGRPFPSLILHKLFSRGYDSDNILSLVPWLLLELYPEQAQTRDTNGNLPLHCFCQHDAGRKLYLFELANGIEGLISEEARATLADISPKNVLPSIIQSYPEAAMTKNRRGRLPLHEAAANKWFDWEDIQLLAKADPEAVDVRDPVTGIYPFMMAATQPPIHKTGYDDVTKIFILLRESPENVRRFAGDHAQKKKSASSSSRSFGRYGQSKRKHGGDDSFLGGSSSGDDRPMKRKFVTEEVNRDYTLSKSSASSSRYHSANTQSTAASPARKSSSSKAKNKGRPKKRVALSWNDNSDSDDLMDDRDELF